MSADGTAIGAQLKRVRAERRWSLDRLGGEAGVSKAMLGQIERGESMPSVSTLWKIASALRVPLSYFLGATTMPAHSSAAGWHHDVSGLAVRPLFAFDPNLGFEMFVIDLKPGTLSQSTPHAAGVIEHVIVVEGTVGLFVDDQWHELSAGEGRRFAADQPHAYRNVSAQPARIHDLIHYPMVESTD